MPVTYTNRKGSTFYLCQGVTKTGKPRYFYAREVKGEPVEQIPEGYTITESVNHKPAKVPEADDVWSARPLGRWT